MVKINDPRCDQASIAMRSLRANNTYISIKKRVKNYKCFNENKLNLQKLDSNFFNDFKNCPESIKQELIFLWEEVGDLNEALDEYQNDNENGNENGNENDNENDNENGNDNENDNEVKPKFKIKPSIMAP